MTLLYKSEVHYTAGLDGLKWASFPWRGAPELRAPSCESVCSFVRQWNCFNRAASSKPNTQTACWSLSVSSWNSFNIIVSSTSSRVERKPTLETSRGINCHDSWQDLDFISWHWAVVLGPVRPTRLMPSHRYQTLHNGKLHKGWVATKVIIKTSI